MTADGQPPAPDPTTAQEVVDHVRDDFLALLSHELRTPLTSIAGFVEVLREAEPDAQRREFLAIVDRNTRRLTRLVDDLLFAADLDSGGCRVERRPLDLRALVAAAVGTVREEADGRNIDLRVELGHVPACAGDADRLAQALDNVLSNALKFSVDGGRVDVRLRAQDERLVVEVQDAGCGMRADERERAFERFYRGSGACGRTVPGVGLGLTIVKAIVDAHGGDVALRSSEGAGTTLAIVLPAG